MFLFYNKFCCWGRNPNLQATFCGAAITGSEKIRIPNRIRLLANVFIIIPNCDMLYDYISIKKNFCK